MLRLEGVEFRRGAFRLTADWALAPGDRAAVIGPSGSGKSTLLMGIGGFLMPARGRLTWQGQDMAPLPPGDRPVSILFQDHNLFPHLTLAQNLGLGLSARLRLTPAEAARIDAALDRVGLSGLGARKPGALSGGQQSRAALARTLLRARPILLLDEPFSALGPALKSDMLGLVTELADETGALVVMVTHDPADARRFADQTILVSGGIAALPVPTETLFRQPPQALRDYLGP
ncbi:MAG: ATP-binding cassette domain-containing protein [Rhodobacter sp.]|nr:ATP-binding cassette domain-containing protein [Rhodobacter sp.]MCA3514689.1 ATP-binding cassette domain-containing protein [Rhodobacter sp.]MCA3518572.1 ATP-binding cassette domain-containing protein [Rhodobacter sp.]MCA3523855.1 ATP-binding cassette domain-containing protein [Rhodobacter sp.]MCA3524785.1 ATP-binding cassette domain-containing protein [Rhodobacter sp.]